MYLVVHQGIQAAAEWEMQTQINFLILVIAGDDQVY